MMTDNDFDKEHARNLEKSTMKKKCKHEFYGIVCIHCGVKLILPKIEGAVKDGL